MLLHFVLLYSTFHTLTTDSGSTITVVGFTILADFTCNSEMQSLNNTIKTHPIVYTFLASSITLYYGCRVLLLRTQNSTWYNYCSTIYHPTVHSFSSHPGPRCLAPCSTCLASVYRSLSVSPCPLLSRHTTLPSLAMSLPSLSSYH